MGKLLVAIILFAVSTFVLSAQDPEFVWAKQIGGTYFDEGRFTAIDDNGNVYTTGYFAGTCDFDPSSQTYNLTSFGNDDIFITKLDGSGNFIYAKQMGGPFYDMGYSMTFDSNENLYITGTFAGTCDFDPSSATYNLQSFGANDIFITKLDSLGNFVWAKKMGGINDQLGYSIDVDNSGNVFTTGWFKNTTDFDPGPSSYNLSAGSSENIFVSKLDASGNFVWAKQMGGVESQVGYSIAVDYNGNVYTTGYFRNTSDFDPSTETYNLTAVYEDIFVSKLDESGNFIWAKQFGGTGSTDEGHSIVVDGNGNVFTTGKFFNTCDFDPGSETYNLTAGSGDIFVSKLNASGDFVWARQIGGTGGDDGNAIILDYNGNVYTTGYFSGTCDFDPSPATYNLSSYGNKDIFISKLDASGDFLWAKQMGGTSEDIGNSIAIKGSGNVYATGFFKGTCDFDPSSALYNLTSFGWDDIYVLKLNEDCSSLNISVDPMDQDVNICSNATFNIIAEGTPPLQYTWYKNGIQVPGATSSTYTTPTLSLSNNGNTYYCIVSDCNGSNQAISSTATLTVIPPCIYNSPSLTLSSSSLIPGQNLSITGLHFTPNGLIDLFVEDESGQNVTEEVTLTYINPGMFQFTIPVTSTFSDGEYIVIAQDISTGNTTSPKTFIVNNFVFSPLEITFPTITSTIFRHKTFDIEWKDFVSRAPVNGQTGELLKEYKIEASPNNGGIWHEIETKTYKAITGKINTFTYPYSVTSIGPYLFRITEIGNPVNTATSPPFSAVECDEGGFVASLQWDVTVPTDVKSKKPYPYGLAADGAARVYVRLNKTNATAEVSTIQATIQTVGTNGYSGTALLGKIAHESATQINSTSITYSAGSNNNSNANSYWFWLVAPDDFTTDLSSEEKYREINVDFTITYSDNSTELITLCEPIQICRPALVFVHGFLGDPESFKFTKFINNLNEKPLFSNSEIDIWKVIKFVDLKGLAAFEVNADILLGKTEFEGQNYENSIISVIKQMHAYGFANKRIDYVAHSMGGAVGRTAINNGGAWYSPGVHQLKNYGNGYVNKYISICTPHNGSPIGDLAIDAYEAILYYASQHPVAAIIAGSILGTSYFVDLGFVYKGEISQAIENLQAQSGGIEHDITFVKNHLITADVDKNNNATENDIISSINTSDIFGKGLNFLFKEISTNSTVNDFFSENYSSAAYLSNTDLIVPLSSQLAGKPEFEANNIVQNITGVSETSIIYGLDKQHVGIQKNDSIGTRIKYLLNAQMNSGFFDESIPPYSVNQNIIGNSEIRSKRSSVCTDTLLAYIDTFKIKIISPISNSNLCVDSSLQISVYVKDTNGLVNLRVMYKSAFYYSLAKDTFQLFQTALSPADFGKNTLIAIAEYDSMGCSVYQMDTIVINVITLDTLEGFYIDPRYRYLNPEHEFVPEFHTLYPTFIGYLSPNSDSLTHMILDTNVVSYDTIYDNFVTKDTGSTHIVFSYKGFSDTMFVYISTRLLITYLVFVL